MSNTTVKPMIMDSWEAVDGALARLGQLEPELAGLQARLDSGIARLKERHGIEIECLSEQIKALQVGLGEFLTAHRAELAEEDGRKNRQLNNGRVGLCLSPPKLATVGRIPWKQVLSRVALLPKPVCQQLLRIEVKLDKQALKEAIQCGALTEEKRKALGVKIEQEEQPYYELTAEAARLSG